MRKLFFVFYTILLAVAYTSCSKPGYLENRPIIEPPWPIEVIKDTIVDGSLWGLKTGDDKKQVYKSIQTDQYIGYLGITGIIPTTLTEIKNNIGLYTQLLLDETKGTPSGMQFYFENDRVKSIYVNNGDKLSRWPSQGAVSVTINDSISSVYDKLVTIKANSAYANKFERISLFSKNIAKDFDERNMNISNRWEISSRIGGEKKLNIATLIFTNDKLDSIYHRLEVYN